MKLGYKILIGIAIGVGIYKYATSTSKDELAYISRVNDLITDIRREDYFAIQNRLDNLVAQKISIDDIKSFTKDLNLSRDTKFVLDTFDKENKLVKIDGTLLVKNKEIPLTVTYKENNNSVLILEQHFGSKILKPKKYNFPIKATYLK